MTIAVVSKDVRETLAECLRSLEPDVADGRAQVWVVDNASSDGAPDVVRDDFPWATLVACNENLGYGRAVNLVAERTESPWLAAANNDVMLEPDALAKLLDTGEADSDVAIVAPRLILPDGSTQHSALAFPTIGFTLLANLPVGRLSPRLAEAMCMPGAWRPDHPRDVPWALGAFLLIRRRAFDLVGGFDPAQWLYGEDLDLGWRMRCAGFRTRYEPRAQVRHVQSVSTTHAFGDDLKRRWTAATYDWLIRRRGVSAAVVIALLNLVGSAARFLMYCGLSALRPARWCPARDRYRYWTTLHLEGLRRALRTAVGP